MSECERGLARPWSWTVRPYRIKLTFERDCGLRFACERGGEGGRAWASGGKYKVKASRIADSHTVYESLCSQSCLWKLSSSFLTRDSILAKVVY